MDHPVGKLFVLFHQQYNKVLHGIFRYDPSGEENILAPLAYMGDRETYTEDDKRFTVHICKEIQYKLNNKAFDKGVYVAFHRDCTLGVLQYTYILLYNVESTAMYDLSFGVATAQVPAKQTSTTYN